MRWNNPRTVECRRPPDFLCTVHNLRYPYPTMIDLHQVLSFISTFWIPLSSIHVFPAFQTFWTSYLRVGKGCPHFCLSSLSSRSGVLENSFLQLLLRFCLYPENAMSSPRCITIIFASWPFGPLALTYSFEKPKMMLFLVIYIRSLFAVFSTFRASSTRIFRGGHMRTISSQGRGSLFAFGNPEQVFPPFCSFADWPCEINRYSGRVDG